MIKNTALPTAAFISSLASPGHRDQIHQYDTWLWLSGGLALEDSPEQEGTAAH